jgi:Legume lectin domain
VKRRSTSGFAFCLLTAIVAPSAAYGQLSYPNFSSTSGLNLVGSATVVSNAIQLTTEGTYATASAVWRKTPLNVGTGFSTAFSYTIDPAGGADGIAFVIQNDPRGSSALGGDGGGLGANGIAKGVAIAFRTYIFNDVEIDSCGVRNRRAIFIGDCVVASISVPAPGLSGRHTVQINESGGLLKVSLDGSQILSGSVNLATAVGGNTAYVGITGADGSASETATIHSWSIIPGLTPGTTPVPPAILLMLLGLTFVGFWFRFRGRYNGSIIRPRL